MARFLVSTARTRDKLPSLLAGPIVRRSTIEQVHLWLATSIPIDEEPRMVEMFDAGDNFRPLSVTSRLTSVRLGLQLFVHIIAVTPDESGGEFSTDVPLLYDIILNDQRLRDLTDINNLTLPKFELPSFIISDPADQRIHALYGSCRKLHGPSPDMIEGVVEALEQPTHDRPRYLFLGGDQIYGDDVEGSFLKFAHDLAIQLIGFEEQIPGLPPEANLPRPPEKSRGRYLNEFARVDGKKIFTSTHKDFHLLSFGEYAAIYLLAWNHELWFWPGLPESVKKIFDKLNPSKLARKALANVVTYMIFDDHEITDDWFRTAKWRRRALANESTKRIILNGLTAYWAFQGWGNDPSAFPHNFRRIMSDFAFVQRFEDDAERELLRPGRWSFLAPTPVPALFLDTRTGRSKQDNPSVDDVRPGVTGRAARHRNPEFFVEEVPRSPEAPRLLGRPERDQLKKHLEGKVEKGAPLIIVAPSPVFGFRPIEETIEIAAVVRIDRPTFIDRPNFFDFESWASNPQNAVDFVDLIFNLNPRPLVVLSGDVHYGFELAASLARQIKPTIRIAQFCSSALKNSPTGAEEFLAAVMESSFINELPVLWWEGDDGAIGRYFATTTKDPNFLKVFEKFDERFPSFVIHEKLWKREGGTQIIMENNLGELILDSQSVRHRFWRGTSPDEFLKWETTDWPVTAKML